MTSPHPEIQAFLTRRPVSSETAPQITKAGIIPFSRSSSGALHYLVMTPVAAKPELGLPEFQLCKGTRMYLGVQGWCDMRGSVPEGAVLEPLAATALREGIEELGLMLEALQTLYPLGAFQFTSATSRKDLVMWMMAAELHDREAMLPLEAVAQTTASRRWMTLAEFQREGRPDHAHILSLAEEKIVGIVGA